MPCALTEISSGHFHYKTRAGKHMAVTLSVTSSTLSIGLQAGYLWWCNWLSDWCGNILMRYIIRHFFSEAIQTLCLMKPCKVWVKKIILVYEWDYVTVEFVLTTEWLPRLQTRCGSDFKRLPRVTFSKVFTICGFSSISGCLGAIIFYYHC